jgi:hypothetical protein
VRKTGLYLGIAVLLFVLLLGCSTPKPASVPLSEAALKVTGTVDNEVGWTEEQVRAMDTIEAESTNKEGETSTYTGVPIAALLEEAGVQDSATTLVYVADDGYTGEVAWAEVQACEDCIVSFRDEGGFRIVMPGFSGKVQVKGVVEIQVK